MLNGKEYTDEDFEIARELGDLLDSVVMSAIVLRRLAARHPAARASCYRRSPQGEGRDE